MTLALVLALHLAQQAPPEPVLLDGVAVQAGEALVTFREFDRVLKRLREQDPPRTPQESALQEFDLLRNLWTLRLEEQKGQDLGLDPAQIARINRANLEAEREKSGLQAYLADLRKEGKDALADEADEQRRLLRGLWEYSALGYPVAGRRATRDRTIRPGELRAIFEENKRDMKPITVELRWLIFPGQVAGGAEAARARCEEARRRALAGEDPVLLAEELGAETGTTQPVVPKVIRDPALAAFAETAEVGDLTEILPLVHPKTGKPDPELGCQFLELHDRTIPPLPEFGEPEVQRVLQQVFTKQRQDRILGRAREDLRREAYSWANPDLPRLFGGQAPPPAGEPPP